MGEVMGRLPDAVIAGGLETRGHAKTATAAMEAVARR